MRVCFGAGRWPVLSSLLLTALLAAPPPGLASPIDRPAPASGSVVSRASGEVVRFVADPSFRDLVVGQDLLAGDLVRTGAQGALSLLFVNRTVMRLHPNTELLVREVDAASATLELTSGLVWARTPRDGAGTITVETPSAAAAIRGTDWSLAFEGGAAGGELTRLTVFDGAAELSNPQGTITVPAGAAGIARPGQAPVLVQVASSAEREQMLFALTAPMAATSLSYAADGVAGDAPPSAWQEARARLGAGDHAGAAAAMEAAAPGLAPERAAAARWVAAFARAAAGEPMVPPEGALSADGTVMEALGRAYLAAYAGDLEAAARLVAGAGDGPVPLSHGVEVALYRDRADEAERLLARLQAIAAGSVEALSAEADVARIAHGDDIAAAALYRRALALEPDRAALWSDLALAEYGAGHPLAAEAALRRSLELASGGVDALANLAVLLLDQFRHGEARPVIDQLLEMDPGNYVGLRAAARLAAQEGRDDDAMALGLAAVAAQPAAAESSAFLAIAAWQAGDRTRALQELDAAARLDPNDPIVPAIRTVIALDEARADDAIRAALEAQRLYRQNQAARRLAADRASGSYVVGAFSNLGLDDWARDVADRTFDPLAAASLFSEALTPRAAIVPGAAGGTAGGATGEGAAIGSSLIQGLLLEPLGVAGRVRDTDLLRRPFLDFEITGRLGLGDPDGYVAEATVQGYAHAPVPVAAALTVAGQELDFARANDDTGARSVSLLAGTQPSARFGAVGFVTAARSDRQLPGPVAAPTALDDDAADSLTAGTGFTVRLADRSVLSGFAALTTTDGDSDIRRFALTPFGPLQVDIANEQVADSQFAGLGWRADDLGGTWFAGIEGTRNAFRQRQVTTLTDLFGNQAVGVQRLEAESWGWRAYADRRMELGGAFDVAAELGLTLAHVEAGDAFPLSPRAGLAATLAPGHRVRGALVHETNIGALTLGPATVLGLVPVAAPVQPGGETAAVIARYDGTFGERLHLSLEHQTVRYEDLFFDVRDLLGGFTLDAAVLHRTELAANAWLGGGVGAFASFAFAESEITGGPARGFDVPAVPEQEARIGLTWVHPAQIRARVEERFIGERAGDALGGDLSPVWTTDASLFWEPLDKRLRLGVEARNIFDADVELPFGQGVAGRSVWLSGSVRF